METATAEAAAPLEIRTNSQPQDDFVFSEAFETLYGGRAGGGKTHGMAIAALLGIEYADYSAIVFRRTYPELFGKGGIVNISKEFYPAAGGVFKGSGNVWAFANGAEVAYSHMQHKDSHYAHMGKEYHFVGFEELSHFTEEQYTYLFSRIRRRADSACPTRMAATANPGARWVYKRWAAWLDKKHPNPAAPGELRYYKLVGEEEQEVEYDPDDPLQWSRTFIPASYKDNPDLNQSEYERNLDMLPYIERQRLKYGDWAITPGKGTIFNQEWFGRADRIPDGCSAFRFWDFAATEKKTKGDDPDYTATCYLATDGRDYYLRFDRKRVTWKTTKKWVGACMDKERWALHGGEEEGGASGKALTSELADLADEVGASWFGVRPSGDKVTRALRWSRLVEEGRVFILTGGEPIDNILHEFHSFPDGSHDDMVDAGSGAYDLSALGRESPEGEY